MKKNYAVIAFSLLFFIAIISGTSYAENRKGAFTLHPHIGGYVFEGNQDINSGPVIGVGLGYNVTERIGLEGVFNYVDTDASSRDRKPDVEAYLYRFDVLYHFMPDGELVPFLSAGVGAINVKTDVGGNDDETNMMVDGGGGVKVFIKDYLALRGEVRYVRDVEDDFNNFMYTIGLNFMFGGLEKKVPMPEDSDGDGVPDDLDKCPDTPSGVAVDSDGCPMDSDGDGVYDSIDQCPDTPRGAIVDSKGCPKDSDGDGVYDGIDQCPDTPGGVPVDSKGCPKDSDGDGVPDNLDKCPGTPAGARVDSVGCPLDSDGDGVYDYLDECPGTPEGIEVDKQGCPVPMKEKVSIELKVTFALNSAVIKSVYDEHIQKVANFLNAYPDAVAEIDGHTDSTGPEEFNMNLSQKRAESVMKYLIDHGVDPARLKAVGFGESMPIADNSTAEGRQRNRRVEAVISTVVTK